MIKLDAMKAVYCYFFPEVRKAVQEVESKLDNKLFKVTSSADTVADNLEGIFTPPLTVTATLDGLVDVDMLHVPIIKRIVTAYSPLVPGLAGFGHSYPTAGSSEGLFHLLAKLRTDGVTRINVLSGEYEGYGIQAKNLGMDVRVVDPQTSNVAKLPPGYWFISNPSARDGNIIPNEFVSRLCDLGNKVIVDLAYVPSTRHHIFDISHPNIPAVVLSLSKPFGLFRYRTGFTFSREETPSLIGNKWFKDTIRLLQGLKVVEQFSMAALYNKYRPVQEAIVTEINEHTGLGMQVSDAMLLGHITAEDAERLTPEQRGAIAPFKRGGNFRFCLTPYFEKKE